MKLTITLGPDEIEDFNLMVQDAADEMVKEWSAEDLISQADLSSTDILYSLPEEDVFDFVDELRTPPEG